MRYRNENEKYFPAKPSELPDPEDRGFTSESSKQIRIPPEDLVKILLEYDTISFDVFDTLIFRPFTKPADVFMLLAARYSISNFKSIRELAEKEVRTERFNRDASSEVTIYDIYNKLNFYLNIDPFEGAKAEMDLEMDICYANPYMKQVYDILSEQNKEIIAITNMYMPLSWIKKLLDKCGFHIEKIYVSCEHNVDKRGLGLFKVAIENIDPSHRVIHIGDNYLADIDAAKKIGWSTFHYQPINRMGSLSRPKTIDLRGAGLSPLIGSAYNVIINSCLYNGTNKKSDLYEYGLKYGGPYSIGFVTWIHDYCKKNNIQKILFLSRDGYTLKQVYDYMYNDIPCEYALWSHIAAARSGIQAFPYYFIYRCLFSRRKTTFQSTIAKELRYYNVSHLESKLSQYNLTCDTIIGNKNLDEYERFISLMLDNLNDIKESLKDEIYAAKEYYHSILNGYKKVALVDTGWSGFNINTLKHAIEKDWEPGCSVVGFMGGMVPRYAQLNPSQLLLEEQQVYMFSPQHNTDQMEFSRNSNINCFYYEMFSAAPHSSLMRFQRNRSGNVEFVFDIPEVENYWTYNQIRKGILDYVKMYCGCFHNQNVMFKISGSDAALIIQSALSNKKYVFEILGNVLFNMDTGHPQYERNMIKANEVSKLK